MRFQVPQFIETQVKIIGPFTLKQFLWVAGGVSIIFLLFSVLPPYPAFIFSVPVVIIFGGLGFLKISEVPLLNYVAYSLSYVLNPRKYIFKKESNIDQIPTFKK